MNPKTPYRVSNIKMDNICYTDVKSNSKKTIIYIKYHERDKLKNIVFQTPTLLNINKAVKKNDIYELDIPLYGKCNNKVQTLINFFNSLDDKIVKDAKINTKWFNNFIRNNTIKYQKIVRSCEDVEYPNGMIRVKILQTSDFETLIQMNNKNKLNVEDIPTNSWVKMILEVYAIWINENGFGLFVRPILISFQIKDQLDYNYKLMEDSDEIDNIIHTTNEIDNSIFIKAESDLTRQSGLNSNVTSTVLEMPHNDNSFEEMSNSSDINLVNNNNNNLSATSSTQT